MATDAAAVAAVLAEPERWCVAREARGGAALALAALRARLAISEQEGV